MKAFSDYRKSVELAQKELGKTLLKEIQSLLSIASPDGEFYVCSGNGICSLSADSFRVIYKDEPESGEHLCDDDFELCQKLQDDGPYGVTVVCSEQSRASLLKVAEICETIANEKLWVLPYRVFRNRIEY